MRFAVGRDLLLREIDPRQLSLWEVSRNFGEQLAVAAAQVDNSFRRVGFQELCQGRNAEPGRGHLAPIVVAPGTACSVVVSVDVACASHERGSEYTLSRVSEPPGTQHPALTIGALAVIGACLVWHSLQYNFVTDDAYISFVYARNFAEHGSLTFNLGMPVEGYTNFLWTFLLGVFMMVGLKPELMSLVLGTGFALGTIAIVFRMVGLFVSSSSVWRYLAPTLLAFSSGFACWSSGGLETQMFTFWVVLGIFLYARGYAADGPLRWVGVVLALAAMTRPEGLLVIGVLGVHRVAVKLARRQFVPSRDELVCVGLFVALWGPFYAWRWWYYGYPFPNTYYVKAAGEAAPGYFDKLHAAGLHYVWVWLKQTKMIVALPIALTGLLVARPRSSRFLVGTAVFSVAVVYLVYTVRVGGDFMGLHRFIMPVFALSAVAVAWGFATLSMLVPLAARSWVSFAIAVVVVTAFGVSQLSLTRESLRWNNWASDRGIDTPAYLWVYTRDRAAIGKHMNRCFEADDFSIVGGAGAQPYFGRMRGIDVFGLVSKKIAHESPRSKPRPGHNKWGTDQQLLSYEPEFVFSCYSIHASPKRPGAICGRHFWSRHGYELVTLHIGCTDPVHRSHGPEWKPASPEMIQQGSFYTFWKRKDRKLICNGRVE